MMVRALNHETSIRKTKSFNLKKTFDLSRRHVQCLFFENGNDGDGDGDDHKALSKCNVPRMGGERLQDIQYIGSPLYCDWCLLHRDDGGSKTPTHPDKLPSDMEIMKERFAKLLLGEDMSGGGKGVSSALALSNAITNLAASVFAEQKRLEPMPPDRKSRWKKEIDWLLSVTDHIVEFVASQQSKDGINMEIMTRRQRIDLLMNIPALRKLNAILIDQLDQFGNQSEFWYVSRDLEESDQGTPPRNDDKWWVPIVKVPHEGLSNVTRRWLQCQKESVNQVLKAAMAINAQVLSEMQIPEDYIESLPKNGRASLGDSIYKSITVEYFNPLQFLSTMDLSSEHKVLDLKNRIEASIVIWQRKMRQKDGKSSWRMSLEKRELFEERVETILLLLKQQFPGIPQSALDISKIQFNKDVGQAILESYSRVIESWAFSILSKIEDVLHTDSSSQNRSEPSGDKPPKDETTNRPSSVGTPKSMKTLSDFMGWNLDRGANSMKKVSSTGNIENYFKGEHDKVFAKHIADTPKKLSYLEKLENLSGLSPTAWH